MAGGRPGLYPIKKLIHFDKALLDAIDNWRRIQVPIPLVSEAIRALVGIGLESEASKPVPDESAPAEPVCAPKPARVIPPKARPIRKATPSKKTRPRRP